MFNKIISNVNNNTSYSNFSLVFGPYNQMRAHTIHVCNQCTRRQPNKQTSDVIVILKYPC